MSSPPKSNDLKRFINLSVIIPAYNEADGIVETLKSLQDELPESEIIVVDDGSTDGTADRVREFPEVRLIKHRYNRGYGGALKTGMQYATRDIIAWFDADNEHRADQLKVMVARIEDERLAAVLGQRSRSMNPVRGFGKLMIRFLARLLKVKSGTDLNCGLRVFRREVIQPYVSLLPNGYSASLTSTIILLERNYPFDFHPVTVNSRIGQSKVALSDGFETMLLVLRVITLFAPMRVFLRLSFVLISLGLGYGLWVALRGGQGFPVLGAVVSIAGLMIGTLGLIADQISQIRLADLDRREGGQTPPGE